MDTKQCEHPSFVVQEVHGQPKPSGFRETFFIVRCISCKTIVPASHKPYSGVEVVNLRQELSTIQEQIKHSTDSITKTIQKKP